MFIRCPLLVTLLVRKPIWHITLKRAGIPKYDTTTAPNAKLEGDHFQG